MARREIVCSERGTTIGSTIDRRLYGSRTVSGLGSPRMNEQRPLWQARLAGAARFVLACFWYDPARCTRPRSVSCSPSLRVLPPRRRPRDPLNRARQLYNAGDFDGAIVAATEAARRPGWAAAAALVQGRAHLERYRRSPNDSDLLAARNLLKSIDGSAVPLRERLELIVGLAQTLFLEDQFGAAAEMFATAGNGLGTDPAWLRSGAGLVGGKPRSLRAQRVPSPIARRSTHR